MFLGSKCQKFDIILNIYDTQIDIYNATCSENHGLDKYILKLFKMYVNIFLKRYSDERNDIRSTRNIRKILNFNPEADLESDIEA